MRNVDCKQVYRRRKYMNELNIFENEEFGQVRTIEIDEKTYFVAKDIAESLGYKDSVNAIKSHCKGVVKHHLGVQTGLKSDGSATMQQVNISCIPEGDIYRLIVRSKLPSAERFEKWVFDEVLPSIRKHGAYMTPKTIEDILLNPDTIIRLATDLKKEQERSYQLEEKLQDQQPKVIFADAVTVSEDSILIRELAKLLKQNGIDTGEKRLFQWLRDNGYLIRRKGNDYNIPTQRSMEMGLFMVKETVISHSDGHTSLSRTPYVTGKGQVYFINKLRMMEHSKIGGGNK